LAPDFFVDREHGIEREFAAVPPRTLTV